MNLTRRSNTKGLVGLLLHAGSLILCGFLIAAQIPGWQFLVIALGILMVFLFTLLHETSHRTPFHSKVLNIVVSWICGFIVLVPPNWFRYFHFQHHRHTQDPKRDPELQSGKPESMLQYCWHVTGLPVWYGQIKTLLINAAGRCSDRYVPASAAQVVRLESIVILSGYAIASVFLIYTGHTHVLVVWFSALLCGQPFLRLYLMAEHSRCPFVDDMFRNTRTVYTNRLVRLVAWNMPYHAEHHAYPNIPYFNLPAFHEIVKNNLKVTSNGYTEFHRETMSAVKTNSQ